MLRASLMGSRSLKIHEGNILALYILNLHLNHYKRKELNIKNFVEYCDIY